MQGDKPSLRSCKPRGSIAGFCGRGRGPGAQNRGDAHSRRGLERSGHDPPGIEPVCPGHRREAAVPGEPVHKPSKDLCDEARGGCRKCRRGRNRGPQERRGERRRRQGGPRSGQGQGQGQGQGRRQQEEAVDRRRRRGAQGQVSLERVDAAGLVPTRVIVDACTNRKEAKARQREDPLGRMKRRCASGVRCLTSANGVMAEVPGEVGCHEEPGRPGKRPFFASPSFLPGSSSFPACVADHVRFRPRGSCHSHRIPTRRAALRIGGW